MFPCYRAKRSSIEPITFEGGAKKSKSVGDRAMYAPPSGKFSTKAGTYNPGEKGCYSEILNYIKELSEDEIPKVSYEHLFAVVFCKDSPRIVTRDKDAVLFNH